MSEKNLVYKPTSFQKHLWKYHKMTDGDATEAEREGETRYEAFNNFSEEIYHRMFAETPEKLEEPAAGSEVFQKLHGKIDEIPEMENLRERCRGNERWAGIGTTAIIDTLLDSVPKPDQQIEDLRGDEDVEEILRAALESAEDDEQREYLEEMIEEQLDANNPSSIAARAQRNKEAAEGMDSTGIRNALRQAAKQANEQISDEETLMDSLSFGMDPHCGRKARMAVHKKLSKVVGCSQRIKEIAKLAGRMRRIAVEQQRQKPQKGTDEVTGIELGNNIQKMIPSEALFMDDEVEMVFASKVHERSLAQFELAKNPKKEQGPIVMLVDSSGSMGGGPDIWAAAVSLAFLEIAFKQKRAFSILFFGGDVLKTEVFDDWSKIDHEKILDTVSFFAASGGTNFERPMADAINIIDNTGSFENADIVMITDGYASVSDKFLRNWNTKKTELGFNCYSILVGDCTDTTTNEKFSDEVVKLNQSLKDDTEMHKFFKRV